ncbi:hypothetical protein ABTM56_20285, partial [Acinetobacter baumannii]
MEEDYLQLVTSQRSLKEDFDSLVLVFTDQTDAEIRKQAKAVEAGGKTADVLASFQKQTRYRTELPRTFIEALVAGDEVPNLDAELLAELYN